MTENPIYITGCTPKINPIESVFSVLCGRKTICCEVPKCLPIGCEWGNIPSVYIPETSISIIPDSIDLLWVSLTEKKVYSLEDTINSEYFKKIVQFLDRQCFPIYIIVGYAPLGLACIWAKNKKISRIIYKGYAKEILKGEEVLPFHTSSITVSEYCNNVLNCHCSNNDQLNTFDNYMKQFTYRYIVLFEKYKDEKWIKMEDGKNIPEFDYIEEVLFDGTHDKLHNGGLMKYHQAGKPKKLRIQWHIGKSEYSTYLWFEDDRIREVFDKFYGAHPNTKTDFIIRIDSEQRKYELALYRYGLKEPQIIPEDVYQLIVFKNKFEDYRSDNYNQERGAWIW